MTERVRLLVSHGVDVTSPFDDGATTTSMAATTGHLELARTLLRLGADPDVRDHRFDSPPLGWARYFGHQPLIDLLEPLTTPQSRNG
jgi:ankyrin repeat protein